MEMKAAKWVLGLIALLAVGGIALQQIHQRHFETDRQTEIRNLQKKIGEIEAGKAELEQKVDSLSSSKTQTSKR